MLIENGIAEATHFFHIDALSSMVDLKIDFDLQIALMGSILYRLLCRHLTEDYQRATVKRIFSNLPDVGGFVEIDDQQVTVTPWTCTLTVPISSTPDSQTNPY